MSPIQLSALLLGVGAALVLLVLGVGRWVERRRLFHGGVEGEPTGATPDLYPPSITYLAALWAVLIAIGLGSSTFALVLLGLLGGATVVRLWHRGGVELREREVAFGTGQKTEISYEAIAGVVAAPKGAFGRSRGTFDIADREGRWCAAIRYQTLSHGALAVAELIRRSGLRPVPGEETWTRTGRPLDLPPFPFVGNF